MINIPNRALSPTTASTLASYQAEVDAIADYAKRVQVGKEKFKSRSSNPTFRDIRDTLAEMCTGSRRCMYCEDSCADEVEHIKPKDLYPEVVFVWGNYLYACGRCNGGKSNSFAIFDAVTNQLVDVTRKRNVPIVPPVAGDDVLINPRFENPMDYLLLDLRGTFAFRPFPTLNQRDSDRAQYTIDTLNLNRSELIKARKSIFFGYRSRLREYIQLRDAGESSEQLNEMIDALRVTSHPTVWDEMKRSIWRQAIPELGDLFDQAPEALAW